jgi:outer membrane protein OmpA-like peptidoglycan-associated protein
MAKGLYPVFLSFFFALVIGVGSTHAQSPAERRANRYFENFAYDQAIELYEYVIKKNPENRAVIRNLAESYRKTNDPVKTEIWLNRVIESGIARNEDYLFFAQALEANGEKEAAKKNFETYDKLMAADKRGERFVAGLKNYAAFFTESENFKIELLNSNTPESDFAPAFYDTGLLVVSNGNQTGFAKSVFPWNNRRWLDLFYIPLSNDSLPGEASRLPRTINTKFHEGPASFSKEKNLLAFTRNSFYKGKVTRSSDHINKLKIYLATPEKSSWKNTQPFIYNSNEYSTGHPCFGENGNSLYFASDMPGGFGGTDLYVSRFENNTWSKPENLGPGINTEGNELFPFVLNDSLIYFASTGWGGMGGLDIYRSELKSGNNGKAINLGAPINGAFDDFGLIIRENGKTGFFSSNRENGKGEDDVYRFVYTPKSIELIVVDHDDVKPVAGANVDVYQGDKLLSAQKTDKEGKIRYAFKSCQKYKIVSKAEGYPTKTQAIELTCPVAAKEELRVLMKKPKLYANVFDKYLNVDIASATLTLLDVTVNSSIAGTGTTDEKGFFKFTLIPCHEYKITASKQDLPDVSKTLKAPCTDKEEDAVVRLGTGIAPLKGVALNMKIVDEQTGDPVPNAKIKLYNKATKDLVQLMTDEFGVYETVIPENAAVSASASRIGYFSTSRSKADFSAPKGEKMITKELKLLKLREGGIIALEGIYYDLGKFNIRHDAGRVLDYVVYVMNENPSMIIELGSHTDSRGSDSDNLSLSEKRANAAAEYIIGTGVDRSRVSGKGYGETQLKNKCGNGVKCDDKLHQENRRTEIRIVNFE